MTATKEDNLHEINKLVEDRARIASWLKQIDYDRIDGFYGRNDPFPRACHEEAAKFLLTYRREHLAPVMVKHLIEIFGDIVSRLYELGIEPKILETMHKEPEGFGTLGYRVKELCEVKPTPHFYSGKNC